MNIPLCIPSIEEDEIKAVVDVLKSGWLAHGPKTKEFEECFKDYIGVKRAVSLNSCTSALQLAIQTLGIKGEILVPSFTFVASVNSIVTAGAKPVFVDIDYDTCNIDLDKIEQKITNKTKAIMPVHFAGQPSRMDEIMEIAGKHDLKVIEDSAECIGGTFDGQKTGSIGHIGCFSFYPSKNITTGEGGMITTNDEELANKINTLKAHGISSTAFEREKKEKPWVRAAVEAGYNYRMCDILAAIGIVQLKKLDKMNDLRRQHAAFLNKSLDFEQIDLPVEDKKCKHVYQMYTIKVKGIDRTSFIKNLREKGVQANVHFDPPVHLQPYYKKTGWKPGELDVTEKVASSIVTLPLYPQLRKEELDFIVSKIMECIKELKGKAN